jgi:hypothetical protein
VEEMKSLIIQETDYLTLRSLIQTDEKERAAFAYLGVDSNDLQAFYLKNIRIIKDTEYLIQDKYFNSVDPSVCIEITNDFRNSEVRGFLEMHSHAFAEEGIFSSIDNQNFKGFRNDILRRKPQGIYMRMVIGKKESGFTCLVSNPMTGVEEPVDRIVVHGRSQTRIIYSSYHSSRDNPKNHGKDLNQYAGLAEWMGNDRIRMISDIKLGIIAAGGLGNILAYTAPRVGFRDITIIDDDVIEERNYNRLLGLRNTDVGMRKVDLLYRELTEFDPTLEVKIHAGKLQDEQSIALLKDVDILVAGVDNDETRVSAQIFAAKYMKPLFDMGTGIFLNHDKQDLSAKGGRIKVFIPGEACLFCQGLNPAEAHSETWIQNRKSAGYIDGTNESPGSVITFNMTIASMTLSMIMDYITGMNTIPLNLSYDEIGYSTKQRNFSKRSDCPICGHKGIIGEGEILSMLQPEEEFSEFIDSTTLE